MQIGKTAMRWRVYFRCVRGARAGSRRQLCDGGGDVVGVPRSKREVKHACAKVLRAGKEREVVAETRHVMM